MLLEKRRFYNDKMVNPSGRHIIININAPKNMKQKLIIIGRNTQFNKSRRLRYSINNGQYN